MGEVGDEGGGDGVVGGRWWKCGGVIKEVGSDGEGGR